MTDDIRAIGFESFKRNNPNVKKIETAWRGTPEFNAWMEIYTEGTDTTLEYLEEDDHQIGTFYRRLSEVEIEKLVAVENQEVVQEPTGPREYEVIGVVHEHSDDEQTHVVTHVKLGVPRWHRIGGRFGKVEYVLVDSCRTNVTDEAGSFVEMTTTVTVTDEETTEYKDAEPLYVAPSIVSVWEVMFALGEIGTVDAD